MFITVQLACTVESMCCQWDSQQRTPSGLCMYARLPPRQPDTTPWKDSRTTRSQMARERADFLAFPSQPQNTLQRSNRGGCNLIRSQRLCGRLRPGCRSRFRRFRSKGQAGRELNGAQCVLRNRPGLFFLAGVFPFASVASVSTVNTPPLSNAQIVQDGGAKAPWLHQGFSRVTYYCACATRSLNLRRARNASHSG